MGAGHSVFNPRILSEGLAGVRCKVEEKRTALDLTRTGDVEKDELYKAMLISIDAVIAHAERYAALAEKLAGEERDVTRKAELLEIAERCRRVSAQPALNFKDAVQSFWFTLMAIRIESGGVGDSAGRFDQWAYSYFARDLEAGGKRS